MERHRIAIVVLTGAIALGGTPLLLNLRFDFNPLNLKSPKVESVATFLELRSDPDAGVNAIEILKPSLADATALAKRLASLPQVERTMTLQNFVPEGQPEKLAQIKNAAKALEPSLNPKRISARPTDAENIGALNAAADGLTQAAGDSKGPGADAAKRLSGLLTRLAKADPGRRAIAEQALTRPLAIAFDDLRNALRAQPVTLQNLPPELTRDWMTKDGRARLEVVPKGDPNDNEVLRQFAKAVLAVEPSATGAPVSLQEAGNTIVNAFIQAGFWALLSITILLWIALRRFGDVLLTIVPLLLAGLLTLELCVLIGYAAQFRQHHRAAAAARRRRRVQDLLHHGVARGPHQPAAIKPDARDHLQRADHGDGLRQPVVLKPSRHVEHGKIAGLVARHHHVRGGAVPAGAHGPAARGKKDETKKKPAK